MWASLLISAAATGLTGQLRSKEHEQRAAASGSGWGWGWSRHASMQGLLGGVGYASARACPDAFPALQYRDLQDLKAGTYKLDKFCMEPTTFTVKEESQFKGGDEEFVRTKLMTRLTYTLDAVSAHPSPQCLQASVQLGPGADFVEAPAAPGR